MSHSAIFETELVLHGRDILVRPLVADDAADLATAAEGLKALHPYSFVPKGIAEAHTYIETALDEKSKGDRYPFAIVFHGRIVGTTSYLDFIWWRRSGVDPDLPAGVEIGATWLARSAQRTRCNTGAKCLLLSHAFETWRAERVSFRTDERNDRSRTAIQRLGARFEGVRRAERLGADGAIRNSAFYSIVASEWPEVSVSLASLLR
jgi:RimJ/RimL family protein N-acetyltransferase